MKVAKVNITALANHRFEQQSVSWAHYQRWIDDTRAAIGPAKLVTIEAENEDGTFDLLAYDVEMGCEWLYKSAPRSAIWFI